MTSAELAECPVCHKHVKRRGMKNHHRMAHEDDPRAFRGKGPSGKPRKAAPVAPTSSPPVAPPTSPPVAPATPPATGWLDRDLW